MTRSCPWCHTKVKLEAKFCPGCGQSVRSVVLQSNDVFELRKLFQKAGCPIEIPRDTLRSLTLKKGEEIIVLIPKGRGGVWGAIDRGNNSFADLSVDGLVKHNGPFSSVITNNRFILGETNLEITYENLSAYEFQGQVLKGRPKVVLTLNGSEVIFTLALTTGTGPVGWYFSSLNSAQGIFDSSSDVAHKADENSKKAYAFISAVNELFSTINDAWQRQEQT